MVDEVEEPLIGEVEVLEHQHEHAQVGERLEEAAPGGKSLIAAIVRYGRVGLQAYERAQVALEPARVVPRRQLSHHPAQLLLRLLRPVRLQDPGLRLHHLAERPEATPSP